MSLIINTIHGESSTVFQVMDEDETVIASFDTRGGYTRADAEKMVEADERESFAELNDPRDSAFDADGKMKDL